MVQKTVSTLTRKSLTPVLWASARLLVGNRDIVKTKHQMDVMWC